MGVKYSLWPTVRIKLVPGKVFPVINCGSSSLSAMPDRMLGLGRPSSSSSSSSSTATTAARADRRLRVGAAATTAAASSSSSSSLSSENKFTSANAALLPSATSVVAAAKRREHHLHPISSCDHRTGGANGGANGGSKKIEKLKEKIKQIEMARIRAEAAGNKEAEASLARRLEMAKEIVRLMELGFSRSEATKMAQGTLKGGGGTASTGGKSVSDAMAEAKEKGIRFQKTRGVGGEQYYQKYVNGSEAGRFTGDQLKKAAAKRGDSVDSEASRQTKFLESIDREIRKNP